MWDDILLHSDIVLLIIQRNVIFVSCWTTYYYKVGIVLHTIQHYSSVFNKTLNVPHTETALLRFVINKRTNLFWELYKPAYGSVFNIPNSQSKFLKTVLRSSAADDKKKKNLPLSYLGAGAPESRTGEDPPNPRADYRTYDPTRYDAVLPPSRGNKRGHDTSFYVLWCPRSLSGP